MRDYLKVNSGGGRNLNLSNKVDNNTNYERKKIRYLILLIFVVMFTVTGGTYAYLAFTASNNTIVGTTATASLDLLVERKLPSDVGVMVPQLEEYLGSAISTEYNCIDGNGNTVCQVYEATVTNTSTATVKVNGTISFTGIENMPNLKWKRLKNATTVGAYTSYNATTTDAYFERNESFQPGESMTYHFVIWIDETKEVQTDNGTFRVTIEFNPATDEGLTSTIVPISYMKGFTSKNDYSYYRSDAYREKIKNVYFVDYINTTGSVASWDMSDLNMNSAGSVMGWVNTNTTDINYYDLYIGAEQLIGLIDCSWLFRDMTNVENINFDNFDTRVTTKMESMFYNCINLTTLDVSGFDTSNVTSMLAMFASSSSVGYMNLTTLDVSGFDTSKLSHMGGMFQNCPELTNLDVSGFDTSNVTNMNKMFYNCESLTSLDVSEWDTSSVTDMAGMFQNCVKLTSLDVSGLDTSNVTTMQNMFAFCEKITSLDVSGFDTSKVTKMTGMFAGCSELTTLDVSGFDTSNVIDMAVMFGSVSNGKQMNLEYLDVSGFDTRKVTDMSGMFQDCVKLVNLDVSKWNTSKVTDMNRMFAGIDDKTMNLEYLDVSRWDVSSVINMEALFYNCVKLTTLDVSEWNTLNVTNMKFLFGGSYQNDTGVVRIMNLENLDVSKWNTSKVTDMSNMFYNCKKITSLDVSTWNVSNVTNMHAMFGGSYDEEFNVDVVMNLTNLNLSSWNTSSVIDMSEMFQNCDKLSTNITIKNTGTTTYEYMFNGAATESGTQITVNYTSATSSLVDSMIATKSSNSNVVKGSLVS